MLSNSSAPRKNVHIYRDGSLTEETGVRRITFPENHEGAEIEAVTSPEISKPRRRIRGICIATSSHR
ncbi:unnamed protein product [Brassica rapa subsp. trilocularis]